MNKREKSLSDTNSSHSNPEVTTRDFSKIYFLDDNSIVYPHVGSRIVMMPSHKPFHNSQTGSSVCSNKHPNSSNYRRYSEDRSYKTPKTARKTPRLPLNTSEASVYSDFVRMLSNYEPEEMCEILADALKEAKTMFYK